jgi:hypothetical protein
LAQAGVRLPLDRPGQTPAPTIGSLQGGELSLRVANVGDKPRALKVTLDPPVGLNLDPTERLAEIAAGATAGLTFGVPAQGFAASGVCRTPYRAVVGAGGPIEGGLAANLQVRRRWWIWRRVDTGPKVGEGGTTDGLGGLGELMKEEAVAGVPKDLFARAKPPTEWVSVVSGEVLVFDDAFPRDPALVARGVAENIYQRAGRITLAPRSSVFGATRIHAAAGCKVRISALLTPTAAVEGGKSVVFRVRAWVNDTLAYEQNMGGKFLRGTPKPAGTPATIRKGLNTVVVECLSEDDERSHTGGLTFLVLDAADGKPVPGLVFDMERQYDEP